jgi:quercetin dioxygenase-like cupin family protein
MKFINILLINSIVIISFFGAVFINNSHAGELTVKQLESFSLDKQITKLSNYSMRARRIVVPAGQTIDKHEHTTRAGIVYVESGEIIEYRFVGDKKQSRTLTKGETLVEDVNTIHSYSNKSKHDCVLIAIDLPSQ